MRRRAVAVCLVVAFACALAARMAAADVVEIRLHGHYYEAPATVQIVIMVEPDPQNRTLRVEADGDQMYRLTEVDLSGNDDSRLHTVEFKNLEAGAYVLRAEVFSKDKVRGVATSELMVAGK